MRQYSRPTTQSLLWILEGNVSGPRGHLPAGWVRWQNGSSRCRSEHVLSCFVVFLLRPVGRGVFFVSSRSRSNLPFSLLHLAYLLSVRSSSALVSSVWRIISDWRPSEENHCTPSWKSFFSSGASGYVVMKSSTFFLELPAKKPSPWPIALTSRRGSHGDEDSFKCGNLPHHGLHPC